MKPYSILIHGTGTCGEGNSQSADMALQGLLEQLRTAGHSFTSVSMVIDGSTVPIIGAMQAHPAADAPASADAVSLVSISRQLAEVMNLLSQDVQMPGELASDEGAVDEPGVVTLVSISGQLAQLMKGQDDLADLIEAATNTEAGAVTPEVVNENVLKVLALVQPGTQPAVQEAPPKKKKKGAGGEVPEKTVEEKPLEIEEAQPVAILGSGGRIEVPSPDGKQDEKAPEGATSAEGGSTAEKETRDVDGNGLSTRCGALFEDEVEAEDHLNGPMCEKQED